MPRPLPGTFPPYFENYTSQVAEDDLTQAFENQQEIIDRFFDSISEEKSNEAYAPGKWTIKELLQHVTDTERIFNYRTLAIARGEQASLPGFEEDDYATASQANHRSWKSLCDELKAVRASTRFLFDSLTDEMLNRSGISNNKPVTPLALGFITVGHLYHHKKVLEERYL